MPPSAPGSVMKEYGELLAGDSRWPGPVARFAARVRDVSEALAELGEPPVPLKPLPMRLAYHDACHLAHAQGVSRPAPATSRRHPRR